MIHRQTVNCSFLMAIMMLATLGIAVASDTTTTKEKPVIANSTILLFDASDSMGNVSSSMGNASSSTSKTRKIDNAKTAVKTFISGLDPATNEVALIVFYDCGKIVIVEPFTTKLSAIPSKIDMIKPTGYTPLSAAIDYAMDYMNQSANGSKKKIILFTDGEETCPYKAVRKGKYVELSIIGFDIRKGSNQEAKLQEFAKKVGGTYLSAEDASNPTALTKGLQQAYAGGGGVSPINYARVWFEKGYALQNMGRHDEAIQAYDKGIEIDPNNAKAWANKAGSLVVLGRHNEALQASEKAIELDPNIAIIWANKAGALVGLGRHNEALQASEKAIELDPNIPIAWANKASALIGLGRNDEALQASEKAVELDPKNAMAWVDKASAFINLGRNDEALQASEKAIELDPKNAAAWLNKGIILNKLGKYDEALKANDEALKLNPNMAKS